MNQFPKIAVRAIITDQHKNILLLQRSKTDCCPGMWNLPGGKVDFNETVLQALTKEMKEETALDLREASFFQYLDNLPGDGSPLHFITLVFIVRATGNVKINHESADYAWVGKADLNKYKTAFRNEEAMLEFWRKYCNQ